MNDMTRGVYCPLDVPFVEGAIDYDAYARLIERQIDAGTSGLLVNPSSGEPTVLTLEERYKLVECAVEAARGRVPICAGTACESYAQTADLVRRFDKLQIESIMVVTPFYIKPSQAGLIEYAKRIFALSEKPCILYHIPGRAAFRLQVDTIVRLRDQVPNFVGMKNTDDDLALLTGIFNRVGLDFAIFAGSEMPALATLAVGGAGLMITSSNVLPKRIVALYEAASQGDIGKARQLNIDLYPLYVGIGLESSPVPVKYMQKKLGVIANNEHRLPLLPATAETERRLDEILTTLGAID